MPGHWLFGYDIHNTPRRRRACHVARKLSGDYQDPVFANRFLDNPTTDLEPLIELLEHPDSLFAARVATPDECWQADPRPAVHHRIVLIN